MKLLRRIKDKWQRCSDAANDWRNSIDNIYLLAIIDGTYSLLVVLFIVFALIAAVGMLFVIGKLVGPLGMVFFIFWAFFVYNAYDMERIRRSVR